jgi:hypothetical protein
VKPVRGPTLVDAGLNALGKQRRSICGGDGTVKAVVIDWLRPAGWIVKRTDGRGTGGWPPQAPPSIEGGVGHFL